MNRAIITGANGLVGMSVAKYLSSLDVQLLCLGRKNLSAQNSEKYFGTRSNDRYRATAAAQDDRRLVGGLRLKCKEKDCTSRRAVRRIDADTRCAKPRQKYDNMQFDATAARRTGDTTT